MPSVIMLCVSFMVSVTIKSIMLNVVVLNVMVPMWITLKYCNDTK